MPNMSEHLTAIAPTYTDPCLTCDLYMKFTPFHAKQPKNMTLPLNRRNTCTKRQERWPRKTKLISNTTKKFIVGSEKNTYCEPFFYLVQRILFALG